MVYKFELASEARRHIGLLDPTIAQRVLRKIQWFASQDDPLHFAIKLQGSKGRLIRFRIGEYRVIASVDEQIKKIIIVRVGHRREVYR